MNRVFRQFVISGTAWAVLIVLAGLAPVAMAADSPSVPQKMEGKPVMTETATLGGGCFWCLEAIFKMVPGVVSVTSGYAGGTKENPTYKEVCTGDTGHAEVVQVVYDPAKLSYEKLLENFWDMHDPTTLNRQGHDKGTQYRSIILYQDAKQKELAEKSKAAAAALYPNPIVTQIVPLKKFYPAEDYHKDYFALNPSSSYCNLVIRPKVDKFKKKHEVQKPQ
jgi:peptide-methionine (S)-S-oxide reductase